ncbi:hypothetical protein Barb4_03482 [Bacteroidales bacterium Barb4]|nr:hypothetical protein Barb4_03482 [Bacteroidales bacterium Barb4]
MQPKQGMGVLKKEKVWYLKRSSLPKKNLILYTKPVRQDISSAYSLSEQIVLRSMPPA